MNLRMRSNKHRVILLILFSLYSVAGCSRVNNNNDVNSYISQHVTETNVQPDETIASNSNSNILEEEQDLSHIHEWGDWNINGDVHWRTCLSDESHRDEHLANWVKNIGNNHDYSSYYCTRCGIEKITDILNEEIYPKFYISEYENGGVSQ